MKWKKVEYCGRTLSAFKNEYLLSITRSPGGKVLEEDYGFQRLCSMSGALFSRDAWGGAGQKTVKSYTSSFDDEEENERVNNGLFTKRTSIFNLNQRKIMMMATTINCYYQIYPN